MYAGSRLPTATISRSCSLRARKLSQGVGHAAGGVKTIGWSGAHRLRSLEQLRSRPRDRSRLRSLERLRERQRLRQRLRQ